MKCCKVVCFFILIAYQVSVAQAKREDIHTDFVLYNKRTLLEKDIRENVIANTFAQIPDSNTEYRFEAACNAITQFQLVGPIIKEGFNKLFRQYDSLQSDTKRALLEAIYAVEGDTYKDSVEQLFSRETEPLLFSMEA